MAKRHWPANFRSVPKTDIPSALVIHTEGVAPDCWPSGTYYGDGSGGEFSEFPELRRCGVGVATLQNGALWFGVHARLPGPVQTVPRAENCAFLIVLDMVEVGAHVEYIADAELLCTQFSKGPQFAKDSINSDQFNRMF